MKKAIAVILTAILCLCTAFFAACKGTVRRPADVPDDDMQTEIPGDDGPDDTENPGGGSGTPTDPSVEPDNPGGTENPGKDPGTTDPGDDDEPDPGHVHTLAYVDAIPAGCETAGTKAHWRCGTCGAEFLDEEGTRPAADGDLREPALNHAFGAWTSEGKSGHSAVCSRCTEKESMPHVWRDNVCTVCGYALPYTEGLEYELKGEYYAVTGGGGLVSATLRSPIPITGCR